jgi:ribosome-associated protein
VKPSQRDFSPEITFKASRSSGAGGQNVNKVSSRVELIFDINESGLLTDEEKQTLLRKLGNRVSSEGLLKIVSQESRSQFRNKELAREKFYELLEKAFAPVKKRVPTKPSAASKAKRRLEKKLHSLKKESRKKDY